MFGCTNIRRKDTFTLYIFCSVMRANIVFILLHFFFTFDFFFPNQTCTLHENKVKFLNTFFILLLYFVYSYLFVLRNN